MAEFLNPTIPGERSWEPSEAEEILPSRCLPLGRPSVDTEHLVCYQKDEKKGEVPFTARTHDATSQSTK